MKEPNRTLVEQIFRDAKFIHALGIELTGFGYGWCETRMFISEAVLQQHGFVHAGALMTLADHTCGGAAATTVAQDQDVITVETKTSFLRSGTGAVLICRGKVLRSGKTIIFTESETTAERDGEQVLITKMSSTLSIIPRRSEGVTAG